MFQTVVIPSSIRRPFFRLAHPVLSSLDVPVLGVVQVHVKESQSLSFWGDHLEQGPQQAQVRGAGHLGWNIFSFVLKLRHWSDWTQSEAPGGGAFQGKGRLRLPK